MSNLFKFTKQFRKQHEDKNNSQLLWQKIPMTWTYSPSCCHRQIICSSCKQSEDHKINQKNHVVHRVQSPVSSEVHDVDCACCRTDLHDRSHCWSHLHQRWDVHIRTEADNRHENISTQMIVSLVSGCRKPLKDTKVSSEVTWSGLKCKEDTD